MQTTVTTDVSVRLPSGAWLYDLPIQVTVEPDGLGDWQPVAIAMEERVKDASARYGFRSDWIEFARWNGTKIVAADPLSHALAGAIIAKLSAPRSSFHDNAMAALAEERAGARQEALTARMAGPCWPSAAMEA